MKRSNHRAAHEAEETIMLAGNPNVGKSTIFNALTGLHQHTGNWPGKTVSTAVGWFTCHGRRFRLVDLPGTYSLMADSPEEEITRDAISYGNVDRVLLVADAIALERNLYLVLQTLAVTDCAVLCVNLMDEAKKRGVWVETGKLSGLLGIPVIGASARQKNTLVPLLDVLTASAREPAQSALPLFPKSVLESLEPLCHWLKEHFPISQRRAMWMAVTLVSGDEEQRTKIYHWCGEDLSEDEKVRELLSECRKRLAGRGMEDAGELKKSITHYWLRLSKELASQTMYQSRDALTRRERKLDRLLTSRAFGYPIMLLLLMGIFVLTIRGADLPSQVLGQGLFWLGDRLSALLLWLKCPPILHDALVLGAFRMLAWVVSVMLPPMLVFFPLFTLLEDVGYLPRIAFNLDHSFHRCGSCGKQALTMGMGLGCNAVGVTGCRIITSPRERLLAILTNSLIPCNGRFPMMIVLIGMFLASRNETSALILCGCVMLSVALTLGMTKLLSTTVLKGKTSFFALELPPYRRPQLGHILIRSLLDRSIFVLGRAAAVAAPAGLLIWALAAIPAGEKTLLTEIALYLDPLGRLMGMDGVILLAFILGSPANETVIPIAMMVYVSSSTLSGSLPNEQIREILLENGWSWVTAASTLLFTMFHWPCTTTLLTIRKETGSAAWTALAAVLPTVCGIGACLLFHGICMLLQ